MVWRCSTRLTSGKECEGRTIPEDDLHAAIASAVNSAYANRDEIIPVLKENIKSVIGSDIDDEIEVIDSMIRKSQMDLLNAGRDEDKIQAIGEKSSPSESGGRTSSRRLHCRRTGSTGSKQRSASLRNRAARRNTAKPSSAA